MPINKKPWLSAEIKAKNRRNYEYKRKYGVTEDEVNLMYKLQKGKCLLCGADIILGTRGLEGAYVDHNHKTGKVRGLLCLICNLRVGQIEAIPDIDNILNYIKN
jgi:hypothetical protein